MTVREMARCGIFAALLAVCAWLAVPVGHISVTMQTFGVLLALGVLEGRLGTLSILVYLLMGVAGAPVFAGFQGGIGVLLGPTGGYLWGFLLAGVVYWCCGQSVETPFRMMIALITCYFCGTLWYCFLYLDDGFMPALLRCVVPYVVPEVLKLWLAGSLAPKIRNKIQ